MAEEVVTVGVDVGGTNTDAAVISGHRILGYAKHVTTEDITAGVVTAIAQALNSAAESTGKIMVVERVHIGTTHFVNAVVQKRNLVKVSVVRLCGLASSSLPPFCYFPENLRQVIQGTVHLINGGYEYDGVTEISPVDPEQVKKTAQEIKKAGVKNIVVSGIFSPIVADQEMLVADILKSDWNDVSITLSHQIGQVGMLERENAAVLNETVRPLAEVTVKAFRDALNRLGLTCPFYLTQNDGTLISAASAVQMPVFTFASGPTNSMRGAAFLSGIKDGIVVDIGGTTTDVGMLTGGFPREAGTKVQIAQVQTNFRMPDVMSFGLGGGSLVQEKENHNENISVEIGPISVGYQLTEKSMVFGGSVMTASDIAVAAKLADMGDSRKVSTIKKELVEAAVQEMRDKLEVVIEQVKISKHPVPVILVGGGCILIDSSVALKGCKENIKPPHFEVANAVGAALSQVSGSVDFVVSLAEKSRAEAIEEAKQRATQAAVEAGAQLDTIQVTDIHEVPLAYQPGDATRVKVKVVGDLIQGSAKERATWSPSHAVEVLASLPKSHGVAQTHGVTGQSLTSNNTQLGDSDYEETELNINEETGEWFISHWDIECIAVGAGILGCGGGGSPNNGRLRAHNELNKGRRIRVFTPERFLKYVKPEDRLVSVCYMGAPTIWIERLFSDEGAEGVRQMEHLFRSRGYTIEKGLPCADGLEITERDGMTFVEHYEKGQDNTAGKSENNFNLAGLTTLEIGGGNGMEPLIVGAQLDLPVIDADFMGRAFPELQMSTHYVYGIPPYPVMVTNYDKQTAVALKLPSLYHVEYLLREICIKMGCAAAYMGPPMTVQDVLDTALLHSTSRAWRLGQAVLRARKMKQSPIDIILQKEGGKLLITGKIVDVERRTVGGFVRGHLEIEGFGDFTKQSLFMDFQNENLIAKMSVEGTLQALACTPDLLSLVDVDTGQPVSTELVRYGLRVAVLAIPAPPRLATEKALKIFGPQAFGHKEEEVSHKPFAKYIEINPVPPI